MAAIYHRQRMEKHGPFHGQKRYLEHVVLAIK